MRYIPMSPEAAYRYIVAVRGNHYVFHDADGKLGVMAESLVHNPEETIEILGDRFIGVFSRGVVKQGGFPTFMEHVEETTGG